MESSVCSLLDSQGRLLAQIHLQDLEDDWYYGRVGEASIPRALQRDLEWYDEVISQQLLSHLDDALHAVERHGLAIQFSDETCHRVYSLHVGKSGEATFRITPVPPPGLNRSDHSTVRS